jgi:hypothetical protein
MELKNPWFKLKDLGGSGVPLAGRTAKYTSTNTLAVKAEIGWPVREAPANG